MKKIMLFLFLIIVNVYTYDQRYQEYYDPYLLKSHDFYFGVSSIPVKASGFPDGALVRVKDVDNDVYYDIVDMTSANREVQPTGIVLGYTYTPWNLNIDFKAVNDDARVFYLSAGYPLEFYNTKYFYLSFVPRVGAVDYKRTFSTRFKITNQNDKNYNIAALSSGTAVSGSLKAQYWFTPKWSMAFEAGYITSQMGKVSIKSDENNGIDASASSSDFKDTDILIEGMIFSLAFNAYF